MIKDKKKTTQPIHLLPMPSEKEMKKRHTL